jgi:hypothetical protein
MKENVKEKKTKKRTTYKKKKSRGKQEACIQKIKNDYSGVPVDANASHT